VITYYTFAAWKIRDWADRTDEDERHGPPINLARVVNATGDQELFYDANEDLGLEDTELVAVADTDEVNDATFLRLVNYLQDREAAFADFNRFHVAARMSYGGQGIGYCGSWDDALLSVFRWLSVEAALEVGVRDRAVETLGAEMFYSAKDLPTIGNHGTMILPSCVDIGAGAIVRYVTKDKLTPRQLRELVAKAVTTWVNTTPAGSYANAAAEGYTLRHLVQDLPAVRRYLFDLDVWWFEVELIEEGEDVWRMEELLVL